MIMRNKKDFAGQFIGLFILALLPLGLWKLAEIVIAVLKRL